MYRHEIVCFKVHSCVVLLNVLSGFAISYKLGYFTPVTETVSTLWIVLLLEAFKKHELLFCGPIAVENREIEPVNDMVLVRGLIEVSKAADTIIGVIG